MGTVSSENDLSPEEAWSPSAFDTSTLTVSEELAETPSN